jgi:hypothetical protein
MNHNITYTQDYVLTLKDRIAELEAQVAALTPKPKAQVRLWGVVYKYKGESDVYVEWFNRPADTLDANYHDHVIVLARAVPFHWEGESV